MADAAAFSTHRDHLIAVAYRMLGSRADAEDVVQDAWLRYAGADPTGITDLRAWLTTVTGRLCLDQLRSARVRREAYVGPWLPEPVVARLPDDAFPGAAAPDDPADRAVRLEEVSLALLVVLERLSPEQRIAFVLHDVFGVPFDEIAAVLATTAGAARQLASRARRAVGGDPVRHSGDRSEQLAVVSAFLAAADGGDLDGLIAVLAPQVVAVSDGGGAVSAARRPVVGAEPVARFMAGLFRKARAGAVAAEAVLVNGDLGLVVEAAFPDGRTSRVVMGFAVAGGCITAIFDQLNPAKLARVPAVDRSRNLVG